jgi:hypothetical protein
MSELSDLLRRAGKSVSPLVLSDRLLTLAKDADRAGFQIVAEHLLYLASDVLDGEMECVLALRH